MSAFTGRCLRRLLLTLPILGLALPLTALVEPDQPSRIRSKEYRHADLYIPNRFLPVAELSGPLSSRAAADLAALGVPSASAYLDLRGSRWGALMPATPLLPGSGVGNQLTWEAFGRSTAPVRREVEELAWNAFVSYLEAHRAELGIETAELIQPGHVTLHNDAELVQINAPRLVNGIPVRHSFLTAVINHGNLILFGARNWGDVQVATVPTLSQEEALQTLRAHLDPLIDTGIWKRPYLEIVPLSAGTLDTLTPGAGYDYRLVWVLHPTFAVEDGQWEALVDAHSGELLAFQDTVHYVDFSTRQVVGGAYPVSNDGLVPDGVEQPGTPMPWTDLENAGNTYFTDTGGNVLACLKNDATTTLSGIFVRINDNCGPISESSSTPILDLGTSGGTDCTVPPGASPGNTHAARTGFYELNKVKEHARGQLPNNTWLQGQLTANMNINLFCNATWNGTSVQFYRSGGGCNNTGELAGVFDHEWGHGMDNNDAAPFISNSGEGIADIYAALRLNTSCMGRNFRSTPCGGYGDPCTSCTGVRDVDWANRASGQPHDIGSAFPVGIDALCGAGGSAPCGGSAHCEGAVQAESVWDLIHRDLPTFYGMDLNTALEIATRLTYQGAGPVGTWFNCVGGSGTGDGCNGDGGYLNFLAADDDNGNLNDGTPHMAALFSAFDRHEIACATPTVQDSGCAGNTTTAPSVTATPQDRAVNLSWGAVAGATEYRVFRTEGVFACDFGKVLIATTTETSFKDAGLANGREYYYTVIPMGPADSCFGPASSCTPATPTAGANLALDPLSATVQLTSGDGDPFLDNCEEGQLTFGVLNVGTGSLSGIQILDAEVTSHPAVEITSSFPVAVGGTIAECGSAPAALDFRAAGLGFNDTVTFRLELTANELDPKVIVQTVSISNVESDFQHFATRLFDFETDLDGWQLVSGTFNHTDTGGGAEGSSFYVASSAFQPNQCDHIRSPLMTLGTDSTLSLHNQFNIEDFSGTVWYDRANIGLHDVATGQRSLVSPDGGRAYNASGANGTCGTDGQDGWAGSAQSWAESTWSATALGSAGIAGDFLQIDVRYGTDPGLHLDGFWFDQVRVTNVDFQVEDTQSNTCLFVSEIFTDGFESGDTTAWSAVVGEN